MPRFSNRPADRAFRAIYFCCLLAASVCTFVPFKPLMPAVGLDPAWMFAMNKAVAQGLVFGRDIIFTFGPYAAIYSTQYYPTTNLMSLIGGWYLAICYAVLAAYVVRDSKVIGIGFLLITAGLMFTKDSLMNTYGLLFAVASFRIAENYTSTPARPIRLIGVPFVAMAAGALGLIIAIKASFLPYAAFVCAISGGLFLLRGQPGLALAAILSPIVVTLVAWSAAGQPLSGILAYLRGSLSISIGYTDAMSSDGNLRDPAIYAGASAFIVLALLGASIIRPLPRIFLFLAFTAYLFIAFKEGFVRHDSHALVAGSCIVIASVILLSIYRRPAAVMAAGISLAALVTIDFPIMQSVYELLVGNVAKTFVAAADGIRQRTTGEIHDRYLESIAAIRAAVPLPVLPGTSDLYSYSLSPLLASENTWSPRPVMQSYSAYTPWLQRQNQRHLQGDRAPDNIFFRVESIDGRLPSLEDAPSWVEILRKYTPVRVQDDMLTLTRKSEAGGMIVQRSRILEVTSRLNERVTVPKAPGIILAEIDLNRSMFAQAVSLAFKSPTLTLAVFLADGSERTYRFVPGMAELGFVISPLVENTGDFALLYRDSKVLAGKAVTAFSLAESSGLGGVEPIYQIRFDSVASPPAVDVAGVFDPTIAVPAATGTPHIADTCEGSIDKINGAAWKPDMATIQGPMSLDGWLTVDAKAGTVPDVVYATLSDNEDRTIYVATHPVPRPDLIAHFKQRGLATAGYAAYVDTMDLHGAYKLGVAFTYRGQLNLCANLNLPIRMK